MMMDIQHLHTPPQTPRPYDHHGSYSDSECVLELDRIRRLRQEEERASTDYYLRFNSNITEASASTSASAATESTTTSKKHSLFFDDIDLDEDVDEEEADTKCIIQKRSWKRQCHGLSLPSSSPLLLPMIGGKACCSSLTATAATNRTTRAVSMDEDLRSITTTAGSSSSVDDDDDDDDQSIVNILTPVLNGQCYVNTTAATGPKSPEFGLRPRRSLHVHAIIDMNSLSINDYCYDTTIATCSTNDSYKYYAEYDDDDFVAVDENKDHNMLEQSTTSMRVDDLPYMPLY